jgi:murein L,D-transpeptidase YcbB/YkuD
VPLELAAYLLRGDPDWDADAILAAVRAGQERTVRPPERIPVHLQYWTAWADRAGHAHFRKDVYGRDRLLDTALSLSGRSIPVQAGPDCAPHQK